MVSRQCKEDILRIIEEQSSSSILYITDAACESIELFEYLRLKTNGRLQLHNGNSLNEFHDMIIINDLRLIKRGDLNDVINELLTYVTHSILVISAVYYDPQSRPSTVIGRRYLYPTRFTDLNFTYREYDDEGIWQIYAFIRQRDLRLLR